MHCNKTNKQLKLKIMFLPGILFLTVLFAMLFANLYLLKEENKNIQNKNI